MPCQCQYGLTSILLGPIIAVAAGAFYIIGSIFDMNGVDWWHITNMFFFILGGVLTAYGVLAECLGICPSVGARELFLTVDEENCDEQGREKAPAPYVMITN
mmetsp:Transcript_25839/g.53591  ORF Transcript_25839/g.53591 Transcript_25839/m.53591 type:complete len:102 (-) Transcript_25839:227-532(-)